MFFSLKTLASTLLLSTAAFGVAVDTAGHLEKRAQPKGIDVSSHQGDVNWNTVKANGNVFAYIKATEGTGRSNGTLVVRNVADLSFQATRTPTSLPSILEPPMPV